MPQVSVIIPTYNREAVIERALNSVLQQSFKSWELIVVDDGSTDKTSTRLEQWQHHSKCPLRILRQENRGVSAARNLGIRASGSPWLAFLDSDDEWLPHKLESQMSLNDRFGLIHGEEIWIRNGVQMNPKKKHAKSGGRIFKRCVDLCCISPSTALVRREILNTVGLFREDFPVCEDYELWLRLCSRYTTGFVTEPVITKYGGHQDQLSRRFHTMDLFRVRALMPYLRECDSVTWDERRHVAQTVIYKCDILIKGYIKHGRPESLEQVQAWRREALSCFTASQNVHSAADRRPRSLFSFSL